MCLLCKRSNYSSLRRALISVTELFPLHNPCTQELPDEPKQTLIFDTPSQQFHQLPMVDRVEVRIYVSLDYPVVPVCASHVKGHIIDGIHRAAIWSEPE